MGLIDTMFRGMIVISFFALTQHGCSVKHMAESAVKAHQKGLASYQEYPRVLTK